MATKTSNVMARVEPHVKEEAEQVMNQLGISASTVINMLYKQIIMTQSIPFSLTIPKDYIARDEMSKSEFDNMIAKGIKQAKDGQTQSLDEAFDEIDRSIS